MTWLKLGDKNTNFFHSKETKRRKNNSIRGLLIKEEIWANSEPVMAEEVVRYFSTLFTSSNPSLPSIDVVLKTVLSRVTTLQNSRLLAPFTSQDIIYFLKQFHPSKALGPDSLPAYFYQTYWP